MAKMGTLMPPRKAAARLSPLARLVDRHVRKEALFTPGARLLVAVSGGPDSVALLALLTELAPSWNLTLAAVHVNHGLRGEEAEEDARFVADLCGRLNIELRSVSVSLDRRRASLQERARRARYEAFLAAGRSWGADRIALGHQADDQAETLLMWTLRGAGTTGLAGIPPIRESLFIRPLLGITREQILAYLKNEAWAYRDDSSNAKPQYLRNRIRRDLLPLLKAYNPSIVTVMARQARVLKEEDRYLDETTLQAVAPLIASADDGAIVLDRVRMATLAPALRRRAVRLLFRRLSPSRPWPSFSVVESVIEQVLLGRTGSQVVAPGITVTRDYDRVRFATSRQREGRAATAHQATAFPLPCPSILHWAPTGQTLKASLSHDGTVPTPDHRVAVFDLDRFTLDLVVRTWQKGDVFQPAGMRGHSKKLQDLFSDARIARSERGRMPLVVAPEGILWVGGLRADHRFIATPSTWRRLVLELS